MTNERLCIFLVFSNLIASKLLSSNRRMHNFIEKFTKINDICKKFAGNRVNEHGNVSRRGVIPTFSDLEVIALSLTAEAFGYDSENNLFKRLAESPEHIPNLISTTYVPFCVWNTSRSHESNPTCLILIFSILAII